MRYNILILILLTISAILRAEDCKYLEKTDSMYVASLVSCWDCIVDPFASCIDEDSVCFHTGYRVTDGQDIEKFFSMLEFLENSVCLNIDTRMKIYCYDSDTITRTVCIGREYILTQGTVYRTSTEIIQFLDSIAQYTDKTRLKVVNHRYARANVVSGFNEVQTVLDSISEYLLRENVSHDDINLTAFCFADKDGNTTKVTLSRKCKSIPYLYIKELESVIMKHIKWTPDMERQFGDYLLLKLAIPYRKENLQSQYY